MKKMSGRKKVKLIEKFYFYPHYNFVHKTFWNIRDYMWNIEHWYIEKLKKEKWWIQWIK